MNFDAWRHFLRARLFLLLRRPQRAVPEYRLALAAAPGFVAAANGLALVMAADQRYDEAEQLFLRSLEGKPAQPFVWYNLGFIRDKQGRFEEAVTALCEATRLAPRLDQAWYALGHAHAALGRHADAASALETAAALVPENGFVWYSLGMAYHMLGEAERVTGIVEHLNRYDRRMTRELIRDTGRGDLEHLIADYKPDFFN